MSSLYLSVTPGYLFKDADILTPAILRQIAQPRIELEGSLGTAQLEDGSVTTEILADGAVTATKMANAGITADSTGLSPFDTQWLNAAFIAWASGPGSTRSNVIAFNNASTPNTKVDITADELVLRNAAGGIYLARGVTTITADIGANASSNGLDTLPGTGAAISTWYYLYLISDGTTVQALISTSPTTPTLPGAFTFWSLVGPVYNDASSHLQTIYIQDRKVWLAETNLFTAKAATAGNTYQAYSTTGGANSLAIVVPPMAKSLQGVLGGSSSSGAMAVAGNAAGVGAQYCIAAGGGFASWTGATNYDVPLMTPQTVYWKSVNMTAINRLSVTGYRF